MTSLICWNIVHIQNHITNCLDTTTDARVFVQWNPHCSNVENVSHRQSESQWLTEAIVNKKERSCFVETKRKSAAFPVVVQWMKKLLLLRRQVSLPVSNSSGSGAIRRETSENIMSTEAVSWRVDSLRALFHLNTWDITFPIAVFFLGTTKTNDQVNPIIA